MRTANTKISLHLLFSKHCLLCLHKNNLWNINNESIDSQMHKQIQDVLQTHCINHIKCSEALNFMIGGGKGGGGGGI